jgi:formylglycine-generating enzyme required for sulfatase activity/dienelactone hydrolase
MSDITEKLKAAIADRYRIERELGAGGMATVYLAHDLKHDRDVAIKVLRQELAALLGPDRFDREIGISARLQHPNILTLIDSGEANGIFYYVMPYVEGESLRQRLNRDGALPIDEAMRYLRDIVDALVAAHRQGVVHRDIKPENVMLSDRHALVMDFGVAKAVQSAREEPQLTTAGLSLGTPTYMAPEQAAGDPDVDHRADLYAVGVLAYEILTGQPPFTGQTAQAVMAAHIAEPPAPIRERRADLPEPLAAAVMRCLAKDRAERWQSAEELLGALEHMATPGGGVGSVTRPARSRRGIAAGIAAVLVIALVGLWGWREARQAAALRWAQEEALPAIDSLLGVNEQFAAWLLARQIDERVPGHGMLESVWPRVSYTQSIQSDPPGATVAVGDYAKEDSAWVVLGTTPLENVRVPRAYMRLRLTRDGYAVFDGATVFWRFPETIPLDSGSAMPDGMVRVAGGATEIQLPGLDHIEALTLRPYLMDRFEVTNREFKAFVDSGGYERPEFWKQPFVFDGRALSFSDAVARFTDRTGRPGPATWEAGDYPNDQDDDPVAGVSWFEAAAYARFAGKELPTVYHWSRAAETWASAWIVPRSNFSGSGAAPVGQYRGMGPYGTFDMAGNVREWCANAIGDERYILGGGWNDRTYQFNDAYAQSPWDRSITNGFRLVRYDAGEDLAAASRPVERAFRDFSKERPVTDAVFAAYRRLYDYDRTPLNPVVEESDSSAPDWIREKISYDAAYGERMFGYLFTPKRGTPPYQTVVYFPGSNALHDRTSATSMSVGAFDFILKSGRAVFHPVYKSTYERGDSLRSDYANETNFYRDHVIAWVKDFRRSVDYLETRQDMDTSKLAYYGVSWGGYLGGLIPALEPRLDAVVLYVAGLEFQRGQPEVEPINYLPRITIPVLMLNGEYDHFFPKETAQRPMFELLGTPKEQKRWVVYEGGHFVPRAQLISETLDWLDRYLGTVK